MKWKLCYVMVQIICLFSRLIFEFLLTIDTMATSNEACTLSRTLAQLFVWEFRIILMFLIIYFARGGIEPYSHRSPFLLIHVHHFYWNHTIPFLFSDCVKSYYLIFLTHLWLAIVENCLRCRIYFTKFLIEKKNKSDSSDGSRIGEIIFKNRHIWTIIQRVAHSSKWMLIPGKW